MQLDISSLYKEDTRSYLRETGSVQSYNFFQSRPQSGRVSSRKKVQKIRLKPAPSESRSLIVNEYAPYKDRAYMLELYNHLRADIKELKQDIQPLRECIQQYEEKTAPPDYCERNLQFFEIQLDSFIPKTFIGHPTGTQLVNIQQQHKKIRELAQKLQFFLSDQSLKVFKDSLQDMNLSLFYSQRSIHSIQAKINSSNALKDTFLQNPIYQQMEDQRQRITQLYHTLHDSISYNNELMREYLVLRGITEDSSDNEEEISHELVQKLNDITVKSKAAVSRYQSLSRRLSSEDFILTTEKKKRLIVVGYFQVKISDESVQSLFGKFGTIENYTIVEFRQPRQRWAKYAIVIAYKHSKSAKNAIIAMDGQLFNGKPYHVTHIQDIETKEEEEIETKEEEEDIETKEQ